MAAGHRRRTPGQRVRDVLVHLQRDRLVVQRPHGGGVVEGIAQPNLVDRFREPIDERVLETALHEDPLARCAALPCAEEAADDHALDRAIDVGVLEDHDRAVATELQHDVLAGGTSRHRAPGLGRADEADAGDQRVAGDLVAHHRPRAGHEVDRARWQIGFGQALHELHGDRRGRRGGSPNDGIAAGQRRGDHLGGHRQGPVPRCDHPVDPPRDAEGEDELVLAHRGDDIGLEPLDVLGGDPEVLDRLTHLADRFRFVRLALVEAQPVGQVLAVALHRLRNPMEQGRSVEGTEPCHRRSRLVCRLDGARGIGARPFGEGGDHLTGRRADGVEGLTTFGPDPSPADEHLECLRFLDDFHECGQPPQTLACSIASLRTSMKVLSCSSTAESIPGSL